MHHDGIPVNPDILRWARETQGLDMTAVALKLKKDVGVIKAWEAGESAPTYAQLEKLAYAVYHRPVALFFFPEPPQEESPRQSFRTLPEHEVDHIPAHLRTIIRKARVMQFNLAELHDGVNPAIKNMLRELRFEPATSAQSMAAAVRAYLGISLDAQRAWADNDTALKIWRDTVEVFGVSVFKEPFKDAAFSGFCLYDETFPVIYLNNSKPRTRQIFTLFHELAHLLLNTGGVDKPLDEYIAYLHGDARRIEVLCNQFASAFLVPDDDFDAASRGREATEDDLRQLARRYHVSAEVILRKLRDRNRVSQADYAARVAEWVERPQSTRGTGGDYYLNQRAYIGQHYLEQAFSRYYQHRISVEQLADYLGVKVASVPGMEAMLNV